MICRLAIQGSEEELDIAARNYATGVQMTAKRRFADISSYILSDCYVFTRLSLECSVHALGARRVCAHDERRTAYISLAVVGDANADSRFRIALLVDLIGEVTINDAREIAAVPHGGTRLGEVAPAIAITIIGRVVNTDARIGIRILHFPPILDEVVVADYFTEILILLAFATCQEVVANLLVLAASRRIRVERSPAVLVGAVAVNGVFADYVFAVDREAVLIRVVCGSKAVYAIEILPPVGDSVTVDILSDFANVEVVAQRARGQQALRQSARVEFGRAVFIGRPSRDADACRIAVEFAGAARGDRPGVFRSFAIPTLGKAFRVDMTHRDEVTRRRELVVSIIKETREVVVIRGIGYGAPFELGPRPRVVKILVVHVVRVHRVREAVLLERMPRGRSVAREILAPVDAVLHES